MVLAVTVATLTSIVVGLHIALTLAKQLPPKLFGCPIRGPTVRALEECQPARLALRAGCWHPKGRHRDLENRALVAMPAGVTIERMKAHQSERDAEDCRVQLCDLQGNCMADTAANNGTRAHVPF
eukprot:4285631-Amphidinium_carterae.2